jgi:transcriptional regulator
MHPNPVFRTSGTPQDIALVRDRGFGTLAVNGDAGPLMSHVPVLLSPDADRVEMHLVRSNPIARLAMPVPAVIAVTGPDGYVSPDWYGAEGQVPTWNYVAVHLRGRLVALEPGDMRAHLDRLSDHFEARIAGKPPWTTDKMDASALNRMMRQILPFRLEVDGIEGTWKLNQNKADTVRLRAADHVEAGIGAELAALAGLMRAPPDAG